MVVIDNYVSIEFQIIVYQQNCRSWAIVGGSIITYKWSIEELENRDEQIFRQISSTDRICHLFLEVGGNIV